MAEINFNGVGSGIDFNTIRDAIIASRSRPITQLQAKSSDYNNRIEALRQLNASLATLTTSAQALTNRDLGSGRTASPGDTNIITATATSAANVGQIEVNTTRLATTLSQASRSFASTSAPILADGATTATFELRKGGASVGTGITIDSSNNTLAGLRDAINAANAGVSASIVDVKGDGTQQQLVLNSKETGASGRVELAETTATGTLADWNLRSLNPPDNDFSKLNAQLTVNGLEITRSTNTVSDAIAGVTLNLKKTGATNVNVTESTDVSDKLKSFITAYNAIQDFVAAQYKKDGRGRPTGVLAGNSTLQSVQRQLRDAVGGGNSTNGGILTSLAEIGVKAGEDGKLSLDSSVLNEKLKTNGADVKALLFGKTEGNTGIFERVHSVASSLSEASTGIVQNAITGYQNSIKSISDTVTNRLEIINRLRDSLTRQFAIADAAIGQLNGQGTALTNIVKSLQPKNS